METFSHALKPLRCLDVLLCFPAATHLINAYQSNRDNQAAYLSRETVLHATWAIDGRLFSTKVNTIMNTRQLSKLRTKNQHRQGTTVVETAIVLPVFLFFLFAIIEFGHAQLVTNMLNSACRNGARMGSVEGTTSAEVVARVNQTMAPVISSENVTVFVADAGIYDQSGSTPPSKGSEIEALPAIEVYHAEPRQMFVIRARLNYNDVALVPMPFMEGVVLSSQSFMRHE